VLLFVNYIGSPLAEFRPEKYVRSWLKVNILPMTLQAVNAKNVKKNEAPWK